jgi:hypothetical protein
MEAIARSIYKEEDPLTYEFSLFFKERLDDFDHYIIWFRIIRDHMSFIQKHINDAQITNTTTKFFEMAETLRQSAMEKNPRTLNQLNENAIILVDNVKQFKTSLLDMHVRVSLPLLLPPTFISHMLNELEKFRFMIYGMKTNGKFPPIMSMNEHKLWILDIVGHLDGIYNNIDAVNKFIRKRVRKQKKLFMKLSNSVEEFNCYLKHGICSDFTALNQLNISVVAETILYLRLVNEVQELIKAKIVLGTIDEEMLLHMILEEMYYLSGLKESVNSFNPLAEFQVMPDSETIKIISNIGESLSMP